MHRAEAQRCDLQARRAFVLDRCGEYGLPRALRHEEADRLRPQASPRERRAQRRGGVEPLDIVHRDERAAGRQRSTRSAPRNRDRDGSLVGRRATGSLEQQRDSQRIGLRRRERVEQLVELVVEQVAEARERESRLGLGRPRLEDPVAALPGCVGARAPEGGLADAGVAVEDEPRRARSERDEEAV